MEIVLSSLAVILSLISVVLSYRTFAWTAKRDRRQATLDAYNQLQAQALDHLNKYKPAEMREFSKNINSLEYKTVSAYIARIEHFCVDVNMAIYDKDTVYELANGYLNGSIKLRIEPIIDKKNRSKHDYYANIHKVYNFMEAESKRRNLINSKQHKDRRN